MGCSNVATVCGGGGGDGEGGWRASGVGATAWWGAMRAGANTGGFFNLSCALHIISISLQKSLSWNRAGRLQVHLMPAGRYPFIPLLRTKSQKHQTKNRSSKKSHKKRQTNRTNIIATNFVWEQLKRRNNILKRFCKGHANYFQNIVLTV